MRAKATCDQVVGKAACLINTTITYLVRSLLESGGQVGGKTACLLTYLVRHLLPQSLHGFA